MKKPALKPHTKLDRLRNRDYRYLTLEFISVVVGISLVLFVDEVRRNYNNNKDIESSLTSIKAEFEKNVDELRIALPLQRHGLDSLGLVIQNAKGTDKRAIEIFSDMGGSLTFPDVSIISWKATIRDRLLNKIDNDLVKNILKVEIYHDDYRDYEQKVKDLIFSDSFFRKNGEAPAHRLQTLLAATIGKGEDLAEIYQEAIQKIDETLK